MTLLTYKYRLKGKRASRRLARLSRAANIVWNYCVETQKKTQRNFRYGIASPWPSQYDLSGMTKGTSKDLGLHAQSVQSICEQFVKSRDQHKKCPRFRASIGAKRALGWIPFQRQSRQVEGNTIAYLGQTYRFFGEKRRPLPKVVKGGCFVEDAQGRWYVALHVEVEDERAAGAGEVGIDLGLKTLATVSTGEKVENPQSYRRLEEKLAVAQRAGNKRRTKAIHAKIANVRRDHLHKASAKLARENRLIIVGNVNASQLAKTRMAKSVLDAGWSAFRGMLRYKASRHGAEYREVDERFTTQTCSHCGVIPGSSPKGMGALGIRHWSCSACGVTHDRDVNAAQNIFRIGRSAPPRVDESRRAA
jgi:IS605 OrfB family transposase